MNGDGLMRQRSREMSSQNTDVLRCLEKRGFIDDVMAREFYGVHRLAARIHELRQKGHEIRTEPVAFKSRHGRKGQFARYWM